MTDIREGVLAYKYHWGANQIFFENEADHQG